MLLKDLPVDEIARLSSLQGSEINEAKKVLANEATALCRGTDAAHIAAETARRTFEEGASDANLPTVPFAGRGMTVIQALTGLGFASYNKEVKRADTGRVGKECVRKCRS